MPRSFDFTDVVGDAATKNNTVPYQWATSVCIEGDVVTAIVWSHSTRSGDGSNARGESIFTFTTWEIYDDVKKMLPENLQDFENDKFALSRVYGATKRKQDEMHNEILALLAEKISNCRTTRDADAIFTEALSNHRLTDKPVNIQQNGKRNGIAGFLAEKFDSYKKGEENRLVFEKPAETDVFLSRLRLEAMMEAFRTLLSHKYVGFGVLRY